MNKYIKTLLLASVVVLPLAACSGNMHARSGDKGVNCKMSKHMDKIQKDISSATTELQAAIADAQDTKVKQRLQKIVKNAEKISTDLKNCKKMCDAKNMAQSEDKKAGKPAHKKHHATTAAPEAAVKPAAGQPMPMQNK
jgi:hypothetical protein